MDSLEEIKNLVQQKVNQNNSKVILAYFQASINKHNSFCGCNYCQILSKYVDLKKDEVKTKRICERHYYDNRGIYDFNHLAYLRVKIRELKLEKDKLKQLN